MFDLITDPEVIEGYLTDASNSKGWAEGLVRPSNAAEISEVLIECQRTSTPLTVTSQRTSTTGGPVPNGGWLISMEKLTKIISIDETTAVVEAGVLLGELQTELESRGKLFPPDPTSRHECSLGGAIACNASGARSFKYGSIRSWIISVEAILPTGEVVTATRDTPIPTDWPKVEWNQPAVKCAAGFYSADNLLDLIIGQEGALAIISRATIKLTTPSESFFSIFALFNNESDALDFVELIRDNPSNHPGVDPSLIEWFDRACLELIRTSSQSFPTSGVAGVWCEQEVRASELDDSLEKWFDILERYNADLECSIFAQDIRGHNELARLRHAIPAGINEQVVANKMTKVGTDCSVPNSALRDMMAEYKKAPMTSYLFGHIGDNHLHLNLLPKNDKELKLAKQFYKELCIKAIELGGSVSAEHGIGKLKREHLAEMVGQSTLNSFVALKRHLDPAWILGRGNVIAQSSNKS